MSNVATFALENPNAIKDMAKDICQWIKKAASDTVNAAAFKARENLVERMQKEFTLRDNFLTSRKALFVTKVPFGHTENLGDITASVGFSEETSFMRRQDEGGTHEAEHGDRLRIFTDKAREGGSKAGRVQRGYNYSVNARKMIIPLITRGNSHASKQVRRAAVAYKSGMLMYFKRSLFRITSFKIEGSKKTKDRKISFEKELIINRNFERTETPARNFFMPECEKAAKDIQKLFNENMDKTMNRH